MVNIPYLVGASTSNFGDGTLELFLTAPLLLAMPRRAGMRNARVFPLPVAAMPIASLSERSIGQH